LDAIGRRLERIDRSRNPSIARLAHGMQDPVSNTMFMISREQRDNGEEWGYSAEESLSTTQWEQEVIQRALEDGRGLRFEERMEWCFDMPVFIAPVRTRQGR
jgi:hypothetical protein